MLDIQQLPNSFLLAVQVMIGVTLLVSSVGKLSQKSDNTVPVEGVVPKGHFLALGLSIANHSVFAFIECVVGLALVILPTNLVTLVAATGLFCAFLVWSSIAFRQVQDVSCNCFGSLSDDVVDGRQVTRNLVAFVLLGVAIWLASTGNSIGLLDSLVGSGMIELTLASLLIVAIGAILLLTFRLGQFANQGAGDMAPSQLERVGWEIDQSDLDSLSLVSGDKSHPRLGSVRAVLFLSQDCTYCHDLIARLSTLPNISDNVIAITSPGNDSIDNLPLDIPYLVDNQMNLFRKIEVSATPAAVLLDDSGKLTSDLLIGSEAILNFI